MNQKINEIFLKYIKDINGLKYFCGDESIKEDCNATVILANICPYYIVDDEEEIYIENEITCYNCRYRRWAGEGFSCYKGFEIIENQ